MTLCIKEGNSYYYPSRPPVSAGPWSWYAPWSDTFYLPLPKHHPPNTHTGGDKWYPGGGNWSSLPVVSVGPLSSALCTASSGDRLSPCPNPPPHPTLPLLPPPTITPSPPQEILTLSSCCFCWSFILLCTFVCSLYSFFRWSSRSLSVSSTFTTVFSLFIAANGFWEWRKRFLINIICNCMCTYLSTNKF